MMSFGRDESIMSLLNVHDISKGASPLVAKQAICTASPGLEGVSPNVKGTINGGTRKINKKYDSRFYNNPIIDYTFLLVATYLM